MSSNDTLKVTPKFICEKCNFKCKQQCDWKRHINRLKHVKEVDEETKVEIIRTCQCGKGFTTKSGYWKHIKKCEIHQVTPQVVYDESPISTEAILSIIQQNQEFKDLLLQQNKTIIELSKTNTINNNNNNTIHNNSHNKSFNLQLFLNETCKDAMNLSDFVNSIQLQLSDFENIGEQGYVNGISNIIIKNLNALEENMRPVHCSDVKRESIYVKENNKWQKDTNDNESLKKAIKAIAHKNTKMMPKYREKYPETQNGASKASDAYSRFVIEALGGAGDNNDEKHDKIVKKILKEIVIHKDKELSSSSS